MDTIYRQKDGSFFYENNLLQGPQITTIFARHFNIQNICIAPGYQLKISADALDDYSTKNRIKISGNESECYAYNSFVDSILTISFCGDIKKMPEQEAIRCLSVFRDIKDSMARIVFVKNDTR